MKNREAPASFFWEIKFAKQKEPENKNSEKNTEQMFDLLCTFILYFDIIRANDRDKISIRICPDRQSVSIVWRI